MQPKPLYHHLSTWELLYPHVISVQAVIVVHLQHLQVRKFAIHNSEQKFIPVLIPPISIHIQPLQAWEADIFEKVQ